MITTDQWLPIGSVVHVEGAPSLMVVAGCMQKDAEDGRLWDYFGYPYPVGNFGEGAGAVFNKDVIDGVYFIGLQDVDGLRYQDALKADEEEFNRQKAEAERAADRAGK